MATTHTHSILILALLCTGQSLAQTQAQAQAQTQAQALAPVTITAAAPQVPLSSDVIGLGDTLLAAMPLSASVVSSQQIQGLGAKRLADLTQLDASTSDAYNTVGYWDYATVRGFVIDNKYNYRREGLPISAETVIPLDNKASVEILKGISGLQAGVSAPGGLVNYTVKRPSAKPVSSLRLEANSNGSVGAALDLSARFGTQNGDAQAYGYRINAAVDKLDNYPNNTKGNRQLLAVAGDWRVNPDTLVQAEVEYAHRSQISVPGLSLLGSAGTLPQLTASNARLNINSQAWSQPVVLDGLTGSITVKHGINDNWRMVAQLGSQALTSQDRGAFPLGCSKEGNYDRYCSDGTFDLYDFRSANERRRSVAAQVRLKGQLETGSLKHSLTLSVSRSRASDRLTTQAYNYVGEGSIHSTSPLPADTSLTYNPANRRERSTELAVSDVIAWNKALTTWAGVRFTQLSRNSVLTDGTQPTAYSARLAAPWLAASYQFSPNSVLYASYGQGLESEITPNRVEYSNAGQVLPTAKSQQIEIGVKSSALGAQWQAAAFSITRPAYGNANSAGLPCDVSKPSDCTRLRDGNALHRGVELSASSAAASSIQPWFISAGITALKAERQASSIDPSLNGLRPTNVPRWIARLNGEYRVQSLNGLALQAHVSHEAARAVAANNSINLPAWTRLDLSARYNATLAGAQATWTIGVDNALNKRYFKESPTQYGHVYLFTGAPRTVRVAVQIAY